MMMIRGGDDNEAFLCRPTVNDDGDDVENVVFLRRPVIVSQPEHLVVDNGMTISLPCIVDQIPGET